MDELQEQNEMKKLQIIKKQDRTGKRADAESGMMVVEAVLSFTVFVVTVAAIVYLITIFMLHNRIQFAINSAAHELASYSYIYQVLGIRGAGQQVESDGAAYVGAIDNTASQLVDTLNKIENLRGSAAGVQQSVNTLSPSEIQASLQVFGQDVSDTWASVGESASQITALAKNPGDLLVGMIYMAADVAATEAKRAFATFAAKGMTEKYLAVGEASADAYLRQMGVKEGYGGLDFSGSTMFCDADRRMIDIVVEYDIDLTFLQLIVPDARLHMVQRVSVAGWLDGDGKTLAAYGVKKR